MTPDTAPTFAIELSRDDVARLVPGLPASGLGPVLVVGTGDTARLVGLMQAADLLLDGHPPVHVLDAGPHPWLVPVPSRPMAVEDIVRERLDRITLDMAAEMAMACAPPLRREEPPANGKGFYRRFEKRRPDGGFARGRRARPGR